MLIDIYGDSILEQGNKLLESVSSGNPAWIKLFTHFLLTVGDDPIGLLQIIQNASKVISNERQIKTFAQNISNFIQIWPE